MYGPIFTVRFHSLWRQWARGGGVVPPPFASLVGPAARGILRVAAAAALMIIRLQVAGQLVSLWRTGWLGRGLVGVGSSLGRRAPCCYAAGEPGSKYPLLFERNVCSNHCSWFTLIASWGVNGTGHPISRRNPNFRGLLEACF